MDEFAILFTLVRVVNRPFPLSSSSATYADIFGDLEVGNGSLIRAVALVGVFSCLLLASEGLNRGAAGAAY